MNNQVGKQGGKGYVLRDYLKEMKHVIGFTAIIAVLLFGMTFVTAGNAAVVPAGNNAAPGVAAVVPPRVPPVVGADVKSNFNRPAFNRAAFVRPALVRPAFNPFFVRPVFNPFFNADVNAFGADFD